MVKVDATRDYYADLELPPTASDADIKKQFRKLALLYHPDRNPGNEIEYNARFQAIQAAHEVLGDPEKRAQYDQDRRRGNVNNSFARPAPPRRANMYQATSNYPPPPRRTQPRAGAPGRESPAGNSGADRYANFPKPRPQSTANYTDAKERANLFNAWQHMNNAQKAQAQQRNHSFHGARRPMNPPPESFGTARPRTNDTSPPRSAWDEMNRPSPGMNRQPSGRVPNRSSFDPSTPDSDGGPPSTASMQGGPRFNRPNRSQFENGFPPEPPPRNPAPTARKPDPSKYRSRSGDDIPFAEPNRISTPYSAMSGEKTLGPDSLRRSASTRLRDDPRVNSLQSEGRRRSADASTNLDGAAFAEGKPFELYSSGEESEGKPQSPSAKAARGRTPSNGSTTSSGSSLEPEVGSTDPGSRPKAQPGSSWTKRPAVSPLGRARSLEEQGLHHGQDTEETKNDSSGYGFPAHSETFPQSSGSEMRSRGSESSLRGGPSFQASNDPKSSAANAIPRSGSHPDMSNLYSQYTNRPHHPSPMASPEADHRPPPSPPPATNGQAHVNFDGPQRQEKVQQGNWASQWAKPQSQPSSPSRPIANSRRQRGSNSQTARPVSTSGNAPQPTVEDDVPTTGASSYAESPPRDFDAMDVDTGPPAGEHRRPSITVENAGSDAGPKPVYMEPGQQSSLQDGLPRPNPPIPPPTTRQGSSISMRNPNSRQSSNISMNDFRHVAPFSGQTSGGMRDMNDLSANLPFPSQPSNSLPADTRGGRANDRVDLPKVPKSPLPPQKLTNDAWTFYLQQMNAYLTEWNKFNSAMVAYFQEHALKQNEMERGPSGGMVDGWLGAVGETQTLGGWDTYVRELKDQERMRRHWNAANEKHMDAVERHTRLRNQILSGNVRG